MRIKNILSIAAFVTTFALSAAFAGLFIAKPTLTQTYTISSTDSTPTYTAKSYCNLKRKSSTAVAIADLIANDHANGDARSDANYDIDESYPPSPTTAGFKIYANNVEKYVNASSSMSTSNLPPDFKTAWREHMKAWRDYSNFLNKTVKSSDKRFLDRDGFEEAETPYNHEISRTWAEVLEIGNSYGADVR